MSEIVEALLEGAARQIVRFPRRFYTLEELRAADQIIARADQRMRALQVSRKVSTT